MSTVGFTPSSLQFGRKDKKNQATTEEGQQPEKSKNLMDRFRQSRPLQAVAALSVLGLGAGAAAVATADKAEACDSACFSTASKGSCAETLLKKGPFAPTNVNLFEQQIYEDAVAYPPASTTQTERQVLKKLQASLVERLGRANGKAAMNLMNNPTLKAVIPDVALRASVVNLTGTVDEPAIQNFLNGTFSSYKFGPIAPIQRPDGSVIHPIALTTTGPDGKQVTVVNDRYKGEDFRLLTPTAGHEAKHSDGANSGKEELVMNAIESDVYFQLLAQTPRLAQGQTELTQRLNGEALAKLNTRDGQTGALRIFESEGTVFPNSTSGQVGDQLDSYGAAFGDLSGQADTPGSATLDQVLSKLTGQPVSGAGINDETIALLDQDSSTLSPKQLVEVAKRALLLDVGRC